MALDKLVLKTGKYEITWLMIKRYEEKPDIRLKDYGFSSKKISVLAMERGNDTFYPSPMKMRNSRRATDYCAMAN